jgi:hypothetical protein
MYNIEYRQYKYQLGDVYKAFYTMLNINQQDLEFEDVATSNKTATTTTTSMMTPPIWIPCFDSNITTASRSAPISVSLLQCLSKATRLCSWQVNLKSNSRGWFSVGIIIATRAVIAKVHRSGALMLNSIIDESMCLRTAGVSVVVLIVIANNDDHMDDTNYNHISDALNGYIDYILIHDDHCDNGKHSSSKLCRDECLTRNGLVIRNYRSNYSVSVVSMVRSKRDITINSYLF